MRRILAAVLSAMPVLAGAGAAELATGYRVVEIPALPIDVDAFNYVTPASIDPAGHVWINVATPFGDHDILRTERCTDQGGCTFSSPKDKSHLWRASAKGNFVGAAYSKSGAEWQVRKLSRNAMERLWQTTNGGAISINGSGTVVGSADMRPVLFDTVLRMLPDLGGGQGEARDIDDAGTVVGQSTNAQGSTCAVKWVARNVEQHWCRPRLDSWASAISANGVIVGQAGFENITEWHAARFDQDGTVVDLGALIPSELNRSGAADVNRFGQVVGWGNDHSTGDITAVRWFDAEGPVDLSTLIPDADRARYDLQYAKALNDSGQILVSAVLRSNPETTVVLRLDPIARDRAALDK